MLAHILATTQIEIQIFPLLYAISAISDIIQCASWLFPCQLRFYCFQFGSLLKSFVGTWTTIILYLLIYHNTKITLQWLRRCNILWLIFLFVLLGLSKGYNTHIIFCNYNGQHGYVEDISDSPSLRLVYILSYVFPILLSLFIIIILSLLNLCRLASQDNLQRSYLTPLLRRLQIYPTITACRSLSVSLMHLILLSCVLSPIYIPTLRY